MADRIYDVGTSATMELREFSDEDHYILKGEGDIIKGQSHFHTYKSKYAVVSFEGNFNKIEDNCFRDYHVRFVNLRGGSYKHLGNSCFVSSKLEEILLPETLESIGHNNFSGLITSFNIPVKIKDFPVDNLKECHKLRTITVSAGNTAYKVVDGILYNYDLTVAVFCPNAKTGIAVLPETVKYIGEYCFYGCKALRGIIISPSVESIGDYAFYKASINKLVIPNSVRTIGVGCFKELTIKESLRLSSCITVLPNESFKESNINRLIFSFRNVTEIGNDAISNIEKDIIPKSVSFESLRYLGKSALNFCNETDIFEFFSCLDSIDADAFINTKETVQLRLFSYCPFRLNSDSFHNIPENATLIVPIGSGMIFKNAMPWSTISNIEECSLEIDIDENGNENTVSDEKHINRIKSVSESKNKVDRYFLKDILEELCLNYLYVDSDEEYREALEVLKYNRSFAPAIIPNLEQRICKNWTMKYKIKFASKTLFETPAINLTMTNNEQREYLQDDDVITLPMLDVATESLESSTPNVQVVFDEQILRELQNLLSLAKQNVKIAVSWFTNYSLFKQVKEMATSGIKVQLITNNDLTNNGGYCLNLNELIVAGVEISLTEYPHLLHHKFCIIDGIIVVNGSYNWTRFSAKNYENITVFNNNNCIVDAFTKEFDKLLQKAEHKCVSVMPEYVPERPEYDRSAFKQYVTEELDAEARETSDERDKITALQKAASLNAEYLNTINPEAMKKYAESFKTVKDSVSIQKDIVAMIENQPLKTPSISKEMKTTNSSTCVPKKTSVAIVTRKEQTIVEKVKASSLLMVLDVSVSMRNTYSAGHVHNISKKALSAALAITDTKEVSLWTFGSEAEFIDNIGIDTISKIDQVKCQNARTYLKRFVDVANDSINDNALVIIFTDDDAKSIDAAISLMQSRKNVFWQIIIYSNSFKNIKKSISDVANTSVVSLTDYASMTDEQISKALLQDYILWKKRNNSI